MPRGSESTGDNESSRGGGGNANEVVVSVISVGLGVDSSGVQLGLARR